MSRESFYVCDGPACRLRARDLELASDARRAVPCVGRCDAPVAAFTVEDAASRTIARELQLSRRGFAPEPMAAPGAQRGPHEPLLLRDLFLVDQAELETAQRRGAYRTLETLPADLAQLIATATGAWPPAPPADPSTASSTASLMVAAGAGAGQFALRPILERDPHAVIEGLLIAAHAAGAREVVLELRREWIEARRVMQRALAAAFAAELTGDVSVRLAPPSTRENRSSIAGELTLALRHIVVNGAGWWRDHGAVLCAIAGDIARPGVYELTRGATVADAIAAAGGVVDGVRTSTLGSFWSDGVPCPSSRAQEPAPGGLIVAHARRDPAVLALRAVDTREDDRLDNGEIST